jgi:peptidoglycan-associated lipoprotein
MRRIRQGLITILFLTFMIGLVAGCARKSKPITAKFPSEAETAAVQEAPPAVSEPSEGALGDGISTGFQEGDLPLLQKDEGRDLVFTEASERLKTIYFEYDSAVLSPEGKAVLEQAAQWLKQNPNVNVRIEGNCDERGTTEYNLALGERRALAARRYLVSLGINPERIYTISYGEEKPAVDGHDEAAWKFNRRDDFKISL